MSESRMVFDQPSTEIKRAGTTVGLTDSIYPIDGPEVTFGEVVVRGDLSGELDYNGRRLKVVQVEEMIGLEVGPSGVRGPVWKGVRCQVLK